MPISLSVDAFDRAFAAFEGKASERVVSAVVGAFALIAHADLTLDDVETVELVEMARKAKPFADADPEGVRRDFLSVVALLEQDGAQGEQEVMERLHYLWADPPARELVLTAARLALVADGRLDVAEEGAFARVCRILGANPDRE